MYYSFINTVLGAVPGDGKYFVCAGDRHQHLWLFDHHVPWALAAVPVVGFSFFGCQSCIPQQKQKAREEKVLQMTYRLKMKQFEQ